MPDRLDAIKARLTAATPGEWKVNFREGVIQVGPAGKDDTAWITNLKDANLIAHAPTDLAYLLRLVEAGELVREAALWVLNATIHGISKSGLVFDGVTVEESQQAVESLTAALATYAAVRKETDG